MSERREMDSKPSWLSMEGVCQGNGNVLQVDWTALHWYRDKKKERMRMASSGGPGRPMGPREKIEFLLKLAKVKGWLAG